MRSPLDTPPPHYPPEIPEKDQFPVPADLREVTTDFTPPPSVVPQEDHVVFAGEDGLSDDTLMQSPKLGDEASQLQPEIVVDTPEASPREEALTAVGKKALGEVIEQPAETTAKDEINVNQQQPPKDTRESVEGSERWWKRIRDAPRRKEAPTEQPSQPPDETESAPPSDSGSSGGDEPPGPPNPPEGGDDSHESDDEGEAERRLDAEMKEFLQVVKPYISKLDRLEWGQNIPVGDRDLHYEIHNTTEQLTQTLTRGDTDAIKEYAHKTAARILKLEDEWTIGRLLGTHLTMSIQASAVYGSAVVDDPSKEDMIENNAALFNTQFANALVWHTSLSQADEIPKPSALYDRSRQYSSRIGNETQESEGWVEAKLNGFMAAVKTRYEVEYEVHSEVPLETASLPELRRSTKDLMGQVDSKRQFSIKPATHKGEDTAWSIHDYADTRESLKEMAEAGGAASIKPHEWASKMRMAALEHTADDAKSPDVKLIAPHIKPAGGEGREMYEGDLVRRVCFMDNKGELYADPYGGMPLRAVYEQHGKVVNYEALRQYMAMKYFDLTMPAQVEQEARRATEQVMGREANQLPQGRNPEGGKVVHDLLVPRLSTIKRYTKQQIAEMEQAELQEAREVVDEDNNVVGHIRRIDPQYRASQADRDEAKKYGISLPESGMTFVKSHYHPLAGKAGTHRAKRRGENGGNNRK